LLGLKLAAGERVRQARDLLALLGDANGRSAVLDADRRHERRAAAGRLLRNLSADAHATATAVQGLLEEIRALRMIPAATIVFGFDRMVRDLARTRGKEVEWEVNGADLEVDRKVLEAVKDALLHLVRNAVDHGIELPDGRARAGKPRRGRVGLGFAALEGNRIEVRVTDDGGGMNAAKIRAAAVRAQLLTAEAAEQLDDAATFDLAQRSGLSTASMVTEISGRGLGLAIVKERVESLAGTVRVESRAGAGTTVQITLPTSVATFRGLLVETCRRNFLLGGNFVRAVVRIGSGGVGTIGGRQAIDYDGRTLAVADLADVLDLPRDGERREPDGKVCVVLRLGEDAGGFLVDAVVSEQEALVKDLHPPLVRVRHVAAAGLLGSGTSL
jgi:two-component system chemotaxis sensor kinase CheA